ncbi:tyrosine-type recombinase/integrase [Streptomyces sulphureus]|uniref:tyrosine-type recombinase/integrase n=1 Tax=Streptomyces sulphureus TaxID=47758 RepID=UPI00036096E6|nr:site-specific integrase [Streptomyces sulphureus]
MAYIARRKNRAGEVTSWQVKWRAGGARSAPFQTERFDDEDSAQVFKAAVDEHGQQWPPGWVKGKGYIDPAAGVEDRFVFSTYASASLKNRTGVEERYRAASLKELETYVFPTFGNCDVRSPEHFSKATVGAWVNAMANTKVWRGSTHKAMSSKTLRNLHGLLSSILNEAMLEEPPLRARNPCDLTRLPRVDDDGVDDDDDGGDDMEFLTPQEVAGIVSCLKREEDRRFVRVAYGTGMRWGEITALAKRHAVHAADGEFKLRVARAWKWKKDGGHYLGKPKTKCSRRSVEVSERVWGELLDQGLAEMTSADLIFHNGHGERLRYSTFYDRWVGAVKAAQEEGHIPDFKRPTFHDLRHSHVAALLSDGRHSLTYVQRRLGHESIQTTSDRYGHLLPQAHAEALATIDRALGYDGLSSGTEVLEENVPVRDPGKSLYVAHMGPHTAGFWNVEHAEEIAARWATERGGAVRVEKWTTDWWVTKVGNGLKDVRAELPDRAWVWRLGPTVYAADGTELSAGPEAHELRGEWLWDFESGHTDEPAESSASWGTGRPVTEAAAWGLNRDEVQAAYASAKSDALRVCGMNPVKGQREGV